MKIKLYLDKRPNAKGLLPVRISVSFMGERLITSLGYSMTESEFNALNCDYQKKCFPKNDCHKKHKDILHMVREIEDRLDWEEQKVIRGEIESCDVHLGDIINGCKGKKTKTKTKSDGLQEVFIRFIKSESTHKDLSEGTVKQLYSTMRTILNYAPTLTIREMATVDWLREFVEYNVERGLNNQSVRGVYILSHWFLSWCYKNNYCGNEFQRHTLELKSVDLKEKLVIFLTMDEIFAIQKLRLDGTFSVIRDFFLFQCFTGLRYSDVIRLHKTDIQDGTMHIVTQKTGASLENKLNKYAMAIVERYQDSPYETLFPSFSACYVNNVLKKIGKMAGISEPVRKVDYRNHKREEIVVPKWQLLTSHVGRKSFVVNSLDMGLTATQVIGYTGHSSIHAMQPYISISKKKKDAAMDVWDNATNDYSDDTDEFNGEISH